MGKEYVLIALQWIATIILLILFIPKEKFREAQVAFFFKQLITWLLGLAVVELHLIEYPVRLFPYANKTSFTFEYFVYPSLCAIFNVHYPQDKSLFRQFLYYFSYCSVITVLEVIVERETQIINYIHWDWYVSWSTLFLTFYLTRIYYVWFFRLKRKS